MHAIHPSIDPAQLQSDFFSGLESGTASIRPHDSMQTRAGVTVGVVGHFNPSDIALARILKLPGGNLNPRCCCGKEMKEGVNSVQADLRRGR
jgi:hypothetical protein